MKKKELELILQRLKPLEKYKVRLEQYVTPAPIAADVVTKAFINGDIKGKKVLDACCGNGILGIAASLLGADVTCMDIDADAIRIARENAKIAGVKVKFLVGDFLSLTGRFDTILMNPPFGIKGKTKDIEFLSHAFELSNHVYSFHKAETEAYVRKFGKLNGFNSKKIGSYSFVIPKIYWFHTKPRRKIDVVVIYFYK